MDQALLAAETLLQNYDKIERDVPACKKIQLQSYMDFIFITPYLIELSIQIYQFGNSVEYQEMKQHEENCGCFRLVEQYQSNDAI